jgi:hypothetical protein
VAYADAMLTIRTSKFNITIKKASSALFLWFHNSKGWFVDHSEAILKSGTPMGDWIGPVKSPSRHVGFAAEVKLRSERTSVI